MITIKATLTILTLSLNVMCLYSYGQTTNNNKEIDTHINNISAMNGKVYPPVILIADSVAKAELKIFSVTHPNGISEGQLSLKFYDKTVETLLKNINVFQVKYKFNQDIIGEILFEYFSVYVDIDKKKTQFVNMKIPK